MRIPSMIQGAFLLMSVLGRVLAGPSASAEDLHRLARAERWQEILRLTDEWTASTADFLYYRGLAEARLGRRTAARRTFDRGLDRYPDDSRFPLELGGLAFREHDLDRAREMVRQALSLDPADTYAHDLLGTLSYLSGNLPYALESWNHIDKPSITGVRFEPPTRLSPILLNRLVSALPGETLHLQDLLDTRARLTGLHLFSTLGTRLEPQGDEEFTLSIAALERRGLTGGRRSAILSAVRGLPFQTVHADLFNLDGNAMNLNTLLRWDRHRERLLSRLERPFLLHPQWRWSLQTDLRKEDWRLQGDGPGRCGRFPLLGLERRAIDFRIGWLPGSRWHWSGGPSLVWRSLHAEPGFDLSDWNGWSLQYDTTLERSLVYLPEHRLEVRAFSRLTGGGTLSSPRSRMIRLEGGLGLSAWLEPEKLDWRVSVAYRGGVIGGSPPLDELFFIGFDQDDPTGLRGHIATRDGFKGNAPYGTRKQVVRSEVEKRIWGNGLLEIVAAPFLDVGQARGVASGPSVRGWHADAGIQFRVRTPLGVGLSIDWGWDLIDGGSSWYALPLDPLLPGGYSSD